MIRKSAVITLIFILSTGIQLIGQIVVTRLFGASLDLDVFLAAVALPTIVVTIIYSTLNDVFLPLLTDKLYETKKNEAERYFFSHLTMLTLIAFIFALAISSAAQPISQFFYWGRGEEFVSQVAVQLRYLSLSFPLAVIASCFGVYSYAKKQFNRFPLAQLAGNMANIIFIVVLTPALGSWSLIVGFVASIFLQVLLLTPSAIINFSLKFINPAKLLLAWLPLIVGNFALRSDTLLIRSVGAHLPAGYLVYLNLIAKIFSLSTGVMTIGLQILLLPQLLDLIKRRDYKRTIYYVNKSKLAAIGITTAVTFLLALLAPVIISLLFQGGKFSGSDVKKTIEILPLFILPAIGWGVTGVFYQPLLALKKSLIVGLIYTAAFITGWLTALILAPLSPLLAASTGLTSMLFFGIIACELAWQYYKIKIIPKEYYKPPQAIG